MELSGLIFVALALVWAVVLIPMALRHHDEVAKTRAVDKFSDDMRVLARREAGGEGGSRLVVRPAARARAAILEERAHRDAGEHAPSDAPAPAPAVATQPTAARVPSSRAHRRAAAAAAKRRRRILAVLLAADVVVTIGVPLGWFLTWAPVVPIAVTLLFLAVARVSVRREHRRWAASRAAARRTPAPAPAVEQPVPVAPQAGQEVEHVVEPPASPAAAAERNDQGLAVVSGLDDTSSFPVGLLSGLEATADAGALWDPLPMTLPTYVSKPRAARSVRTIDLRDAGVSSSGRDAADSALVAEAATAAPAPESDRRAVGS